jgi:D-serine deaminase-like pyridoxal phosphate-dependent protein
MMDIGIIRKPTMLLDEEKARSNIARMAGKAGSANIKFRPHFKTHQSAVVGEWYREAGVNSITVSSVTMCRYFMNNGWDDITIAFPANPAEVDDINEIAGQIRLNLLVADYEQLAAFAWKIKAEAGIYVKIDTGYRRTGVDWNHYGDIVRIADLVNEIPLLRMEGLITHAGNAYNARGAESVLHIYNDARDKMLHTRDILPLSNMKVSIGDTPSCSIATDFSGIDEIRPGNFVFYDLMQTIIGSCTMKEVALSVACPVVSVNRNRNELVLYGGAVHLSKDYILNDDGTKNFGQVLLLTDKGWDDSPVAGHIRAVSQEHGMVSIDGDDGKKLKPGDIVAVVPVHSCLTVDLQRRFITMDGNEITDFSGK